MEAPDKMNSYPRPRRVTQRASSLLIILVVMSAISLTVLAAASVSIQSLTMARKAQDRVIGRALAEAGVDAAVDQLTSSTSATTATGTLYEDAAKTKPLGTYSATITDIDVTAGTKKVVSVATTANGLAKTVVARITMGQMNLGSSGALVSSGDIKITGNAKIYTTPTGQHTADAKTNSNISFGGSAKSDGRLIAGGTASGTGYYPSVSGASAISFPSSTAMTSYYSTWYASSRSTSNLYTGANLFKSSSDVTITAPAYISGDVSIANKGSLTLKGSGVIYIDGDLSIPSQGTLINKATVLVVRHTFNMNGQAEYYSDNSISPTPTMVIGEGDVTLNGGNDAVAWGVVFAAGGNLKLNGNASFTGALVASSGQIMANGTYDQYYPSMTSAVSFPTTPMVTHVVEL